MALFYLSLVGLVLSIIYLIFKIIRKESKVVPLIIVAVFAVMFFVVGNQPSIDVVKGDYETIMSGSLNDEVVEIKGDVTKIEKVEDVYFVTLEASDGIYEVISTEDVAGVFPREGDNRIKVHVTPDWSPSNDNNVWVYAVSFPK